MLNAGNAAELLEQLKIVMDWIDNWNPNFSDDEEWLEQKNKIIDAILNAEYANAN